MSQRLIKQYPVSAIKTTINKQAEKSSGGWRVGDGSPADHETSAEPQQPPKTVQPLIAHHSSRPPLPDSHRPSFNNTASSTVPRWGGKKILEKNGGKKMGGGHTHTHTKKRSSLGVVII